MNIHLADILFFSPLFGVVGSLFSLPSPPHLAITVLHFILVSLYSFHNALYTHEPTALQHSSWFSYNFFYLNQQHYSTASGFQSFFYNHSLDIQLGKSFFSLIAKPSALLHSSWFSPFYENFFYQGVSLQTLPYPRTISITVQLLVFFKKSFLSHNTNYQHYHIASSSLPGNLSQTTGSTTQPRVFPCKLPAH